MVSECETHQRPTEQVRFIVFILGLAKISLEPVRAHEASVKHGAQSANECEEISSTEYNRACSKQLEDMKTPAF